MESTTYWMRLAAASAAAERRRAEEVSEANEAKRDSKDAEDAEDAVAEADAADAKDAGGLVLALCCARCSSALATQDDLFVGPRPAHLPPTVWAFDFETLETDVDAFCASDPGTEEPVARFDFIRCATDTVAARCAPNDHASAPSAWFSGLVCSRFACRCGADLGWTYHVPAARGAAAASKASPKEDEARPACAAKDSGEAPVSSVHPPWHRSAESKVDEAKIGDAQHEPSLSTFGEGFTALLTSAVREKTLPPSHLIVETAPVVRRWNRRNAGRVVRSTTDSDGGCQSRQRMLDQLGHGTSSPGEGDPLRVLRQLQLQHGADSEAGEVHPKAEAK